METQLVKTASFENFKAEVLSKRIGRKKVNLNEIKVISDCAIEYAGLTFALSDEGFKSLLKQTGISAKKREAIIKQYGTDFADKLVSMLTRVLADSKNSIVMIIDMNKRKVLNFAKAEESMISNEVYLDEVEKVLNDSNLVIDSMLVKPNGGFEITTLGDKSQWGLKGAENNETFKFGLSFDNSPISGTRLLPFNKRLICTNGMIGLGFTQAHHLCNTQDSWETFYKTITNLKKDNFLPYGFDDRLQKVMSATASVNELLTASNIIRANANTTEAAFEGSNNPNYLPVEHFVPTESTFRAYAKNGIDLDVLNKDQRKNAVSDVKYWDLINGLTDFASHNYGYGHVDSGNIQRFAGKMFVGTPDLSNLVPSPF